MRKDDIKKMTGAATEDTGIIENKRKKLIGKGLFLSNYLFITFLSKHFMTAPHGGAMFAMGNLGTFLVALLLTALMYNLLSKKACLIAIPVTIGLAALAAVL